MTSIYKTLIVVVVLWSLPMLAENQVTTYVITTQQQRESTRWTLTEWLRIKERMKMMDLWLAMFSEPAKDHFSPEVSIYYGTQTGKTSIDGAAQEGSPLTDLSSLKTTAKVGRLQLWLTNLVSGTVGIRTLNIDLGAEGYLRMSELDQPALTLSANTHTVATVVPASMSKPALRYISGNLRVFGKNIQDSSIVFKYGTYTDENDSLVYFNEGKGTTRFSGTMFGGELQLYLFGWLGLEGAYNSFNSGKGGSFNSKGKALEYGAYIEISLLRLMGGLYNEEWITTSAESNKITAKNKGMYAGVKLLF